MLIGDEWKNNGIVAQLFAHSELYLQIQCLVGAGWQNDEDKLFLFIFYFYLFA